VTKIKKTNLNYSIVSKHFKYLKDLDFIKEKNFGRIKVYRYNNDNLEEELIEIWESDIS